MAHLRYKFITSLATYKFMHDSLIKHHPSALNTRYNRTSTHIIDDTLAVGMALWINYKLWQFLSVMISWAI